MEIERDGFSKREMYLMRQAWEACKYAAVDETLDGWLDEIISDGGHYVAQHLAYDADRIYGASSTSGSGEAVAWQFYQDGKWHNGNDNIRDHRKNTEEAGFPVRDLYTHTIASVPEGFVLVRKDDAESSIRMMRAACHPHPSPHADDLEANMLAAAPQPVRNGSFQSRVAPWMQECFGPEISADKVERNHRFLEESLELVQSLGCTKAEAVKLVDYVYGRDVGEPRQEVGGVMVTMAALCLASDMDMDQCAETELARIWTKVDQIREKQKSKPQTGPLPGAYPDRPKTHNV